jgi:hypothetical protein
LGLRIDEVIVNWLEAVIDGGMKEVRVSAAAEGFM